MNVVRYEPLGMLRRFQQDVNRLLEQEGLVGNGDLDASRVATSQWTPAVDIREEADRYLIVADVPGVDPKDIEVTMENGVLTVKGERPADAGDAGAVRRAERVHGSFHRRFSLPETANADAISATGRHGVLEVVIPKQDRVQPRRIEVS